MSVTRATGGVSPVNGDKFLTTTRRPRFSLNTAGRARVAVHSQVRSGSSPQFLSPAPRPEPTKSLHRGDSGAWNPVSLASTERQRPREGVQPRCPRQVLPSPRLGGHPCNKGGTRPERETSSAEPAGRRREGARWAWGDDGKGAGERARVGLITLYAHQQP